jgi:hypothetical protein
MIYPRGEALEDSHSAKVLAANTTAIARTPAPIAPNILNGLALPKAPLDKRVAKIILSPDTPKNLKNFGSW